MTEHQAEVMGYIEMKADAFTDTPKSTIGIISLKPPIYSVGEGFKDAVLGLDSFQVEIEHIVSTSSCSMFRARSFRGSDILMRREHISIIAQRLERLATSPKHVVDLMKETPFPIFHSGLS